MVEDRHRFDKEYLLSVIFWPKLTYAAATQSLCGSWASC